MAFGKKKKGRPKKAEIKTSSQRFTAEWYLAELDRAKQVKEKWLTDFRVSLAYDYWEGRSKPAGWNDDEWISPNMIYSSLIGELPVLYSTDPYFYVKLKRCYTFKKDDMKKYEEVGKVRQGMLNYLKGELELKEKMRACILDTYFQFGIAKVYVDIENQPNPKAGKPIEGENGPVLGEDNLPMMEPNVLPKLRSYKITRIHPNDFMVDADAGPLKDEVTWMAHRIKLHINDFRESKKYPEKARSASGVQPTAYKEDIDKDSERREGRDKTVSKGRAAGEMEFVLLWELYDLKRKKWMVLAEEYNEFVVSPDDFPLGFDGDPFIDMRFTNRDKSWYPIPPVSQWIDPQREVGETRSTFTRHRKRVSARKYEMYGDAFDEPETEAGKLEQGIDGAVLIKTQPMKAVDPIQDAPLDQQIHTQYAYARSDFQEVAIGANQRGARSGVDSATEADILETRTKEREGDRVDTVKTFATGIGRKLDQLVQVYIDQDQAVRVVGLEGEFWQNVKKSDYESIEGEFGYNVVLGRSLAQIPQVMRAQFTAFLTTISNAPALGLSKKLLKKGAEMFEIEDEELINELHEIAKLVYGQQSGGVQGSAPGADAGDPRAVQGGMSRGGIQNVGGV